MTCCDGCVYVKWVREDRGEWHGQPSYESVPTCSLGRDPEECELLKGEEDGQDI